VFPLVGNTHQLLTSILLYLESLLQRRQSSFSATQSRRKTLNLYSLEIPQILHQYKTSTQRYKLPLKNPVHLRARSYPTRLSSFPLNNDQTSPYCISSLQHTRQTMLKKAFSTLSRPPNPTKTLSLLPLNNHLATPHSIASLESFAARKRNPRTKKTSSTLSRHLQPRGPPSNNKLVLHLRPLPLRLLLGQPHNQTQTRLDRRRQQPPKSSMFRKSLSSFLDGRIRMAKLRRNSCREMWGRTEEAEQGEE